jgi:predicted permease
VYNVSRFRSLEWLVLDVQYAARSLVHRRRFAAAAALTLALGIGASTAIYSVVYGVLLRQLPYRDAQRLLVIQTRDRATGGLVAAGFSGPDFEDWRQRTQSLESMALYSRNIFALDADTGFETVNGALVSRQFFAVLGVRAAVGRVLTEPGAREIVISDRLWRRRFAADPSVVGRQVLLNAAPYTIVGVAAQGMTFPGESRTSLGAPAPPPDLWAPFESSDSANKRSLRWGALVARMAPGHTLAQVSSEIETVARGFRSDYPDWARNRETVVLSLVTEVTGALRPALWLLLGAVGCVLLVACANVANLLLVRQTSRAREVALRVSLGAPTYRLISHVLAEALLLALVGGGLGVVMAAWAVEVLRWLAPADLPRLDAIRLDLPVLVVTLGISTLAALVSAVAPAWRLMAAGRNARRIRSALVIVELAVSLVLLVGSTLLGRSFLQLLGTDMGVAIDHVATVELNIAMGRTLPAVAQVQLADRLVAATSALPGVRVAAVANGLPPNRSRMSTSFSMPDSRTGQPVEHQMGLLNPTPGYFEALGIRVLAGRTFSQADGPDGPEVVILSSSAARRLFGQFDVVGRTLPISRKDAPVTIVGVVGDVKYFGLDEAPRDTVYVPFSQYPFRNMVLVARTLGDPRQLAGSLAAVVHRVDREVTIGPVRTLEEVVAEAVALPRLRTTLLATLAGLALILAVVGLYGVASYAIALRTVEIGVRMALGAEPWQVVAMIVRESLRLALTGAAVGLCGAFLVTRTLSGMLYGVTPRDTPSFLLAAAVLVLVTAGASFLAARRAAQVDPLAALRSE